MRTVIACRSLFIMLYRNYSLIDDISKMIDWLDYVWIYYATNLVPDLLAHFFLLHDD